ncbi:hypothetical protein WJX73_000458 [Symbiochloris irregularis]|uniref:Uncharacterized protein n=1 Tax=Symbiochloris irregularis TaxID=706552 RepID=A0AAW1NVK5_9CHLO
MASTCASWRRLLNDYLRTTHLGELKLTLTHDKVSQACIVGQQSDPLPEAAWKSNLASWLLAAFRWIVERRASVSTLLVSHDMRTRLTRSAPAAYRQSEVLGYMEVYLNTAGTFAPDKLTSFDTQPVSSFAW